MSGWRPHWLVFGFNGGFMVAIATNHDRLHATVQHAQRLWDAERQCQARNAVHESSWSVQVVEPILASLGWQRLRRDGLSGDGAYFEWPKKHLVDVALLRGGNPVSFLELKQTRDGCLADLRFKLEKHPPLRAARYGVAGWFLGQPGFCSYTIRPGSNLEPGPILYLTVLAEDPTALAELAAGVLTGSVADAPTWLRQTADSTAPVVPRLHPRHVQRRFFALLAARLGMPLPLETRHRCTVFDPPTPSYAFAELTSVLPRGWGLVFDCDTTVNDIQCFFYRNSNTKLCGVGRWSFDSGDSAVTDLDLSSFIEQRVLPQIERWRHEAIASGLL